MLKFNSSLAKDLLGWFIILGMSIYTMFHSRIGSYSSDIFLHLRVGDEINNGNWKFWSPGNFNSFDSNDWELTQWLSQSLLSFSANTLGVQSLDYIQVFVNLCLIIVPFLMLKKHFGALPSALAIAPLYFYIMTQWFTMRPMSISILLLGVVAIGWIIATKTGRIPFYLIPIFFLWPMIHGQWLMGLALNTGFALTVIAYPIVLNLFKTNQDLIVFNRTAWLQPVLAIVATFNPIAWASVMNFNERLSFLRKNYIEFFNPMVMFGEEVIVLTILSVSLLFVMAARLKFNDFVHPIELAVLLAAIYCFTSMGRLIPVSTIFIVILLAINISWILSKLDRKEITRVNKFKISAIFMSIIGLSFIPLVSIMAPSNQFKDMGINFENWDQTFSQIPDGSNVAAQHFSTSYLLWAYPELNIPSHGYTDAFTMEELERSIELDFEISNPEKYKTNWLEELDIEYGFYNIERYGSVFDGVLQWDRVKCQEDFCLWKNPLT